MAAAADAVVQAAILQEDAADDLEVREEAHGAEDGGAAYGAGLAQYVFHGEVAALGEHGGDDGHARGGDPVIERLQLADDGFQLGHSNDTWYQ